MPTFDPATAYRTDWEFLDGVQDGTLLRRPANAEVESNYPVKLLRFDLNSPDWLRYGAGVGLSPEQTGWLLWLVYPDEDDDDTPDPPGPRVDDAFELYVPGGEGEPFERWMIQSVSESRIGSLYVLGCVKGRVNVYS